MQDSVQQRLVNVNFSVVADEAQLAEFIHEETDARSRCPDHLCESFLADLDIDRLRAALLGEMREKQKKASQSAFARIEQLVDQILFDPAIAI